MDKLVDTSTVIRKNLQQMIGARKLVKNCSAASVGLHWVRVRFPSIPCIGSLVDDQWQDFDYRHSNKFELDTARLNAKPGTLNSGPYKVTRIK